MLTHNFFSWPYYAVLSSRPHLEILLHSRVYSTGRPPWATLLALGPSGAPSHSLVLSVTDLVSSGRKLRLTQDWDSPYLTWASAYILSNHPLISVQPCDCFRLFSKARLVQCISNWRFGQWSICNALTQIARNNDMKRELIQNRHNDIEIQGRIKIIKM